MKFTSPLLAAAFVTASAMSGSAATYNLGVVPTDGASQSYTLVKQTVDFVNFSLEAPEGFLLSGIDIAVTSKAGSNFREMIGLYSDGKLVNTAMSMVAGNGAALSFSGLNVLATGRYTLAVAGWKANFDTDIANVSSTAFFKNGDYTVTITPTIAAIPLPAGGLLLISALGALVVSRRKTRAA